MKILLVEDDEDYRIIIREHLMGEGFEVLEAPTLAEARSIISTESDISLILQDINLPDGRGIDLCREVKANSLTSELPIIFLTSMNDDETILEGFEAAGDDYLMKPVEKRDLMRMINVFVKPLPEDTTKGE